MLICGTVMAMPFKARMMTDEETYFHFFGLLALFLVIVGLGLKIWVDVRRDQQRAIVAVFTQAQQALTQTEECPMAES